MKRCSTLFRVVMCVLFSIVCIIIIARVSIAKKENVSIQAFTHNELIKDNKLNESENTIISVLSSITYGASNQTNNLEQINPTYIECLSTYLESTRGELEEKTSQEIMDRLNDLIDVMNLDKESGMKEMSLDGRVMATHIIEQIYELCGLTLEHNLQGDILRITDSGGSSLYVNKNLVQGESININAIIIIGSIMISLYCACIIISKKNQLFKRDEIYEFEEKGLV